MSIISLHVDERQVDPGPGDTMADRLFDSLSEAIISGELRPNSRIREPELAAQYGVSRAPLREALRRLEERKLVTRTPRSSARVTMITPERIAEIYIVREVLEGAAARIAAERITDAEIVHLQKLLAEHEAQVIGKASETYRMGASDDDFHFFIIRCSGNQALIQLLCDEYYPLLRLFRQQHKHVRGRARRAFVEHHRIIEALADRDGELAETLMRKHISAALAGILSNLSSGIDVPESAEKEVL